MVICFGAMTNLDNDKPETATGQPRVSVENVHAFVLWWATGTRWLPSHDIQRFSGIRNGASASRPHRAISTRTADGGAKSPGWS
jgi:hypothetical protein